MEPCAELVRARTLKSCVFFHPVELSECLILRRQLLLQYVFSLIMRCPLQQESIGPTCMMRNAT